MKGEMKNMTQSKNIKRTCPECKRIYTYHLADGVMELKSYLFIIGMNLNNIGLN
jgi:hypothetical protein